MQMIMLKTDKDLVLAVDDKLIVENAIRIVVKAINIKNDLFTNKFKTQGGAKLIEQGLFNPEIRVRLAFSQKLCELPD